MNLVELAEILDQYENQDVADQMRHENGLAVRNPDFVPKALQKAPQHDAKSGSTVESKSTNDLKSNRKTVTPPPTPSPFDYFWSPPKKKPKRRLGKMETPEDIRKEMVRLYSDHHHHRINHGEFMRAVYALDVMVRTMKKAGG